MPSNQHLVNRDAAFVRTEVETAAADIMAAGAPRPRFYCLPAGAHDATALQIPLRTGAIVGRADQCWPS